MASGSSLPENAQQHFLECGICLHNFQDPRGLPCLHTFCCQCLKKWVGASVDKSVVICPVCKKKADIPDGDVAGFPAHFMVKNLLEAFDKDIFYEKKSDQGQHCKIHNERVRYFCKNEKKLVCSVCVSEKKCHIDHDRVSFKDIHKQTAIIRKLKTECGKVKIKYEDKLKEVTGLHRKLQKFKDELTSTLVKIDKAYEQGSSINRASSEQDVIDTLVSLTEVVYQFSTSPPSVADVRGTEKTTKGGINDDVDTIKGEWKHSGQFNLPPTFIEPQSIAINQVGDIAVTSRKKGVVVLSRTGQVKCYLTNCPKQTFDIAVTPDNRFIVPGNIKLLCYGNNGKQLSTINVADAKTDSLAVDKWGRIITNTKDSIINGKWTIHSAKGVQIASFPLLSKYEALRLNATNVGDIVFSHHNTGVQTCNSVKLMDYLGGNVRVINPPPQVTSWHPGDVCCSKQKSEIYVVNQGQPYGIYKYTAQGDYVSCVTTDVNLTAGIALSPDEKQLFVVEYDLMVVKIFQRN